RGNMPGDEGEVDSGDRVNALLRWIAVGVIARDPAAYLHHVASQYWYLYLLILDKPDSPSAVISASLVRAARSIDSEKYMAYHSIVDADAYRNLVWEEKLVEGMEEDEAGGAVLGFLFEEVMPRLRNPLRGVFILA